MRRRPGAAAPGRGTTSWRADKGKDCGAYNAATVEDAKLTDGKGGDDMKEEEKVVVVEAEVCRVREGAVDDKAPAAAAMLSCHAPSSSPSVHRFRREVGRAAARSGDARARWRAKVVAGE